ncbi:PaaI family thioesterase [Pelagovum sp. HNIBRBA483]|uniref:PaaI family thioesterase n=1 Tax=Pelagovum sp. HNIBRBA483 TaxID=3233341 RepID=UPI0034A18C7D
MALAMDKAALMAFLESDFPQAKDGFVVEEVADGRLTMRLKVTEAHLRPGGTVSGPAMFALADVGVYLAILAMIGPKALAVTTNASLDFMRKPAAGKDMLCEVRVLKLGRALAVCDALLYSEGQVEPVARANMTYSIPKDMG